MLIGVGINTFYNSKPPRKTIISDVFNRTDNTTSLSSIESGQQWQSFRTWGIINGKAKSYETNVNFTRLNSGISNNFELSVDISISSYGGINFRADSSAGGNYYLTRINSSGLSLFRYINGAATEIGSYAFSVIINSTYKLKVRCTNNRLRIFLNENEVINIEDTNTQLNNNTWVGMHTYNDTTTTFDNFLVEAI